MARPSDAERLRRAAARVRASIAAEEAVARKELLPAWRRVHADLGELIDALTRRIERAAAAGTEITPTWLHKEERYLALLEQVEIRIAQLSQQAGRPITAYQRGLLERVDDQVRAMTEAALAPAGARATRLVMADWHRLDVATTEAMVGMTGKGKPLANLLGEVAPDAKRAAAQILTRGVALGRNPRIVARELLKVSDQSLSRLMTIARTEAIRAQREATQMAFQANSGVITRWEWQAALDDRTCSGCIAMSGTIFPVDQLCDGHPNCRCVMVPLTATWDELGLGDLGLGETSPAGQIESGPDWFARQSEGVRRGLLGPAKLDALDKGEIDWPDLVTRTRSREWGTMRRAASLREARAHAKRRRR